MTLKPAHDPSCVLAYPFEEASDNTVYDQSQYGRNGTIYGATRAQGKIARGFYFDGVDDYIETPIFSVQDKLTVAAWAYYIDGQPSGNYAGIISSINGNHYSNRLLLYNSIILVQLAIGGYLVNHQVSGLAGLKNVWHHYAFTYNGSHVKIYLDGRTIYTEAQTGNIDTGQYKPTIGWGSAYTNSYHFKGYIDEVRAYTRAFTDQEIRMIYENEKDNYR